MCIGQVWRRSRGHPATWGRFIGKPSAWYYLSTKVAYRRYTFLSPPHKNNTHTTPHHTTRQRHTTGQHHYSTTQRVNSPGSTTQPVNITIPTHNGKHHHTTTTPTHHHTISQTSYGYATRVEAASTSSSKPFFNPFFNRFFNGFKSLFSMLHMGRCGQRRPSGTDKPLRVRRSHTSTIRVHTVLVAVNFRMDSTVESPQSLVDSRRVTVGKTLRGGHGWALAATPAGKTLRGGRQARIRSSPTYHKL